MTSEDRVKCASEIARMGASLAKSMQQSASKFRETFEKIASEADLDTIMSLAGAVAIAADELGFDELRRIAEKIGIVTFASEANISTNAATLLRGTSFQRGDRS